MVAGDDWEEKMIEQMAEMFKNMGMPIDKSQLRGMMDQFRDQFEAMGLDAEKMAKGDVNFNFDLSHIAKMFSQGGNLNDILSNLGMDVSVDAAVEVPTPKAEVDATNELMKLPADDVYLSGWNMSVTVDFTLKADVEEDQVELTLVNEGRELEVLKETQPAPLARIELPHPCDDVVDWSLNNGILDITLKLTPQGSAVEAPSSEDTVNDDVIDESDDELPIHDGVSIELSDDDDDDEDDGGIPIF